MLQTLKSNGVDTFALEVQLQELLRAKSDDKNETMAKGTLLPVKQLTPPSSGTVRPQHQIMTTHLHEVKAPSECSTVGH